MRLVEDQTGLRGTISGHRRQGRRIGFVPTMGNLHAGHLGLVEAARQAADIVVVSIFVNPMQFGPNEDLDTYPRTPEADLAALEGLDVDVVYLPPVEDIYPEGLESQTRVIVPGLSDILEGASRPGFFTGVATVVNRLLNLVQPDVAWFGRKDYQQLLVIRKMVRDLAMPVEIREVATVREADGLAMSSRNNYLDDDQRARAATLYRALRRVVQQYEQGGGNRTGLEADARQELIEAGFRPDYIEVRRSIDLGVPGPEDVDLVVLGAAWLGDTRLIDNLPFITDADAEEGDDRDEQ